MSYQLLILFVFRFHRSCGGSFSLIANTGRSAEGWDSAPSQVVTPVPGLGQEAGLGPVVPFTSACIMVISVAWASLRVIFTAEPTESWRKWLVPVLGLQRG